MVDAKREPFQIKNKIKGYTQKPQEAKAQGAPLPPTQKKEKKTKPNKKK